MNGKIYHPERAQHNVQPTSVIRCVFGLFSLLKLSSSKRCYLIPPTSWIRLQYIRKSDFGEYNQNQVHKICIQI